MSALKDRIKKQTQIQAKQNRKNRVERSIKNSSHGKTKPSKSDYKYIEGNIRGSASGKHYGIRKYGDGDFSYYKKNYEAGHQKLTNYEKQQKGENPYEVKYKRTAGIKTQPGGVNKEGKKYNSFKTYNERLTNKEQSNYKKYGTLTKPDSELEKKVKKVASGVGKAVLGGLDIMGTPGYLITGATKGMVDGFNGNGKLDKGELKNAIKGATKNIKTSWDNKGKFNGEGKFGFGDVFDSVDALEERKKNNDPNYESKQIYRASTGNGFDRDKLSDKTKKTLNTIGGMGLDMALPMEFNLPLGTLLRGTGKSFTKVAKNVDAGDVAKIFDKMSKGKNVDDIAREVLVHKATKQANKLAGNIDPNQMEGVKLLGKELLNGKQVAKIGDATGISRAYNQVRHFMQKGQRNKTLEEVVTNVANKQLGENNGLMKVASRTPLNMEREQYDLAMGFRPDWKLRKEAKDLDEGFKNKTYERELSDYEKLTNEIQSWIKETERRENSGFKDITNARPKEKPNFDDIEFNDTPVSPTKSFDEEIRELIGFDDDVELNTINNSDMSQLDNIPFNAIQAKRKPRNRRIGNAPEGTMFPYLDEMSGKYSYDADTLDNMIKVGRNNINRAYLDDAGMKKHYGGRATHQEKYGSVDEIKRLKEIAENAKLNIRNGEKVPVKFKNPVQEFTNQIRINRTSQKKKVKLDLDGRQKSFKNIYDNLDPNNITEKQQELLGKAKVVNDSTPKEELQGLINEMNDAFFGGESVISDHVKPSKLGKIELFLNELKTKKNVKFDDRYTQTLMRDLVDPAIDLKYKMLGDKYQYKNFKQDITNKIKSVDEQIHQIRTNAYQNGWSEQSRQEFEALSKELKQLETKRDARNEELAQILKMNEGQFYEAYPDSAPRYFRNAYKDDRVLTPFEDIMKEYFIDSPDRLEPNFDDLVQHYYEQVRPEIELEAIMSKSDFKSKREMDSWIQKQSMIEAEEMAKMNSGKFLKEKEIETIHDKKINREDIGGNVRDNQIKELNQNVKNYRKKLDLKYVDTNKSNVNDYNVKTIKQNIVKIIKSKWDDSLDERALSELYGQQIRMLDKLGVPRESYMPKLKEYETKMEAYNTAKREYIKSQKYKSQNTNPINEFENKLKIKKEQRDNLLEKIANQEGFTFKKKKLNNEKQRYLDKDEIDFDKYFMAQSGDNIGKIEDDFIGSVGESKPQATNDNIANVFDEIRQVLPNRKGFEEGVPKQINTRLPKKDWDLYNAVHNPSFTEKEELTDYDMLKSINEFLGGDYLDFEDINPTGKFKTKDGRVVNVKRDIETPKETSIKNDDRPSQYKPYKKPRINEDRYYANPETGEKINQPLLKIDKKAKEKLINKIKEKPTSVKEPNVSKNIKSESFGDFERYMQNTNEPSGEFEPKEPTLEELNEITKSVNKFMGVEEVEQVMPERPTTEQIDRMVRKENMKKLSPLSIYDGLLKDFKANVTVNNPGWHAGNFVQNKLLNAQDIGIRSFFPRGEEWDVFRGKSGEIVNESTGEIIDYDKFRRYLEEGGITDNFINKEVQSSSESNPLSKLFHNVFRASGKNSIGSGFGLLQKNQDETLAKIQNVMAHMDDGDDILTAMDKAQRTLFDYDDLSDKEKSIAKRIIPFYAYAKKNTANQLDYLMNDQRTHTKLLNAYRNIQEQIPYGEEREIKPGEENYLKGRIQIPGMTKEHKGKEYNYMLNPKLPFNPTDSADGMTNFSPFINPLIDIAKNENFFGEEIEEPVKYYLDELKNSYTHPIIKTKENIERHKEKGQDFRIPPEIMKILLGISGNYY